MSAFANLSESPIKNLHDTVCIGVVVDGGLISLRPAKQHQVELAVALVDQVSCVAIVVEFGVFPPVERVRYVA